MNITFKFRVKGDDPTIYTATQWKIGDYPNRTIVAVTNSCGLYQEFEKDAAEACIVSGNWIVND